MQVLEDTRSSSQIGERWAKLPVLDVMSRPPIGAEIGATASEIAQKMVSKRVGSVIILKDHKPIGLVTDGDLISKVLAKGRKPRSVVAVEIFSKPLRTIDYQADITEAALRMRKHQIKRLGVMKDGKLVGVISTSDIMSIAPEVLGLLSERARLVPETTLPSAKLYSGRCDDCDSWSEALVENDGRFICKECLP